MQEPSGCTVLTTVGRKRIQQQRLCSDPDLQSLKLSGGEAAKTCGTRRRILLIHRTKGDDERKGISATWRAPLVGAVSTAEDPETHGVITVHISVSVGTLRYISSSEASLFPITIIRGDVQRTDFLTGTGSKPNTYKENETYVFLFILNEKILGQLFRILKLKRFSKCHIFIVRSVSFPYYRFIWLRK